MAIVQNSQKGFALLVAVIFMSVMLSLSLGLSSLGYKQVVLSSSVTESQYAFYAADAALECALYVDQQSHVLDFENASISEPASPITCNNNGPIQTWYTSHVTTLPHYYKDILRFSLDGNKHCADITIYKYEVPDINGRSTYLFSQGYDAPCNTLAGSSRFVTRGISVSY